MTERNPPGMTRYTLERPALQFVKDDVSSLESSGNSWILSSQLSQFRMFMRYYLEFLYPTNHIMSS